MSTTIRCISCGKEYKLHLRPILPYICSECLRKIETSFVDIGTILASIGNLVNTWIRLE